jgi:hypothetical protein
MMVNGKNHDEAYRRRLEKDAELHAVEKEQMEVQQTTRHQMEDGMKPKFIQKIQTSQFGVQNDVPESIERRLEESIRRKRASQQTGESFMNDL